MSILSKFRLPYREDYLFGCLLLVALVIPLAFDVYNFESFEIIKFGLLMLTLGCACLVFAKKYFKPNPPALTLRGSKAFFWGLAAFLFWALLASLLAADKNYSFFGFYPRFTNGFLFYLLWSILVFFLAVLNKQQLWVLIKVMFFCSGLVGLWALLQSLGFGYYNGQTTDFFVRSSPSFLGNPNFASMFMAAAVPLGLYFFYDSKNFWPRVYYGLSLFLQLAAVILLASRGAILALGFGVLACLFLGLIFKQAGLRKFSLLCLVCLCLIFGLTLGFLNITRPGTVKATLNLSEPNIRERLGIWKLTLAGIEKKPLIGWGLGSFELLFERSRNLSTVRTGFFDDPHNLFLYLAVSGGIPFLLVFLFLCGYPAWQELKKLYHNRSPQPLESLALSGAILAWMVAAFFTPVAIPCYVLLAFLVSGFFSQSAAYAMPKTSLLSFGGKVLAWAFIIYALCFIAAEHLFFAGISSYNAGNDSNNVADFAKAARLTRAAIYLNPANNLYYEYWTGSTIRAGFPLASVDKGIATFSQFHGQRSYTYAQIANLYYLLFYQTHNVAYKTPIYENLNKAITLDPFSANNYFLFSQYQFIFGDFSQAQGSVQKGLALDPQAFEPRMFLAMVYQYQGNRAMLIKTLEEAAPEADTQDDLPDLIKLAATIPNLKDFPLKIKFSVGQLD